MKEIINKDGKFYFADSEQYSTVVYIFAIQNLS